MAQCFGTIKRLNDDAGMTFQFFTERSDLLLYALFE